MHTQAAEICDSTREAADCGKTVIYSSTTSQVDAHALNYATDQNSHAVVKPTKVEQPEARDIFQQEPEESNGQRSPDEVASPEAHQDRLLSQGPNENYSDTLQQLKLNEEPTSAGNYRLTEEPDKTNTKFISFNDSQHISKHSRQQNIYPNNMTMNLISGATQQSVEQVMQMKPPQIVVASEATLPRPRHSQQASLGSQAASALYAPPPFLEQPAMTFSSNSPAVGTTQLLSPVAADAGQPGSAAAPPMAYYHQRPQSFFCQPPPSHFYQN